MATVLIAGGTGLIGRRLSEMLRIKGHEVLHLSRKRHLEGDFPAYQWNIDEGYIDEEPLLKASHIINLAGAGIADKLWTASRKEAIIHSRVTANRVLKNYIERDEFNIKAYISGSAIGYYGDRDDTVLTEEAAPGDSGFLAESVIQWEQAIKEVAQTGIRSVTFRIGIVLSTKGGAYPKVRMPFYFGLAPYFGNGKQWYSWIHIDDLCRMFIKAVEDGHMKGIYNAVAPNPARNRTFTANIGKAIGTHAILLPTPSFLLRLGMGEMADVVLSGARVSSEKIEATGFAFQFPDLQSAVRDIEKRKV